MIKRVSCGAFMPFFRFGTNRVYDCISQRRVACTVGGQAGDLKEGFDLVDQMIKLTPKGLNEHWSVLWLGKDRASTTSECLKGTPSSGIICLSRPKCE